MMGTMFCQYETPCGWCVKFDAPCTEKGGCKPKNKNENPLKEHFEKALKNNAESK